MVPEPDNHLMTSSSPTHSQVQSPVTLILSTPPPGAQGISAAKSECGASKVTIKTAATALSDLIIIKFFSKLYIVRDAWAHYSQRNQIE